MRARGASAQRAWDPSPPIRSCAGSARAPTARSSPARATRSRPQPVEGYIAACEALGACDLGPELIRLDLPVLCLGGAEDVSTTPDAMRTLAAAIPGAGCEIVPGAGHLPPAEAPAAVAAHVERFARHACAP